MRKETEIKVKELIKLNSHGRKMVKNDERIEEIADKFPDEYTNEHEYIEFQEGISELI